jgi:hypothetical protein
MCQGENQTHRDVLKYFADTHGKEQNNDWSKTEIGTGLFLVPAPDLGILEYRKVFVENLNYTETIKRGSNCKAFSFVPHAVMSIEQLKAKLCMGACYSANCDNGCLCSGYFCA